jgi:exonuclease III
LIRRQGRRSRADLVRIIGWNIRAGGGSRAEALAAQLGRWAPDVVALCEFRATPPSAALARALGAQGLTHQTTTADPRRPGVNALLVASRWPLRRLASRAWPCEGGRWLLAGIASPHPFMLGAMHVPNRATGRKWPFLDAVLRVAERWGHGPAVLIGDTNSGRPGIDEAPTCRAGFNAREGGWIEGLARAGWRDGFRHLRGDERAYTWYSPNAGNGFRLDQAFLNAALLPSLGAVQYAWGRRRPGRRPTFALSDHAALLLDFHARSPLQ